MHDRRRTAAQVVLAVLLGSVLALAPLASLPLVHPARAATIDADGVSCTLHDAIQSFLNGSNIGGCSAALGPDPYGTNDTLNLSTGQTYSISSMLPTFSSGELTVNGNNATIEWSGSGRLWTIDGSGTSVTIRDLTVRGTGGSNDAGLAVLNGATLGLRSVTMEGLDSQGTSGGAIAAINGATVRAEDSSFRNNSTWWTGGAIAAFGSGTTVMLDDVEIEGNRAGAGGAIAALDGAAVVVDQSTISDNSALFGGGIFAAGGADVTIERSTLSGNSASGYGGAILAIYGARVAVEASDIVDNTAGGSGAGIAAGTGDGPGAGAVVTIVDSTIRGNEANGYGGGIFVIDDSRLTVTGSTIEDNRAGLRGGGIAVTVGAEATIQDSTVRDNETDYDGGGLEIQRARARLERVTVSGNRAGRWGGGLNVDDQATVDAVNVTLSGNEAPSGSAANLARGSTLTLSFVTVADHQGGAAFAVDSSSTLRLKNSLLADPDVDECQLEDGATVQVSGVVIADDPSCNHASITVDLNLRTTLGPLQNNGGPTETHALLPGSPALDAVTVCTDWDGNSVATDQRGVSRPQNGKCDVGAFEFRAPAGGGGGGGSGGGSDDTGSGGPGDSDTGSGGEASSGAPGQGGAPAVPGAPSTQVQPAEPGAGSPPSEGEIVVIVPPASQVGPSTDPSLPHLLPRTGVPALLGPPSVAAMSLLALAGLGLVLIGLGLLGLRRHVRVAGAD